jgi:D-glycero-alpha-D-manno-heptose-7-phosphate kinase
VYIESSAPTRIDLAGGTLDIWPLYLFHENAQTLNAAISLRARCSVHSRGDGRIAIVSEDTGRRVEAAHWTELKDNVELKLLGRLLHFFEVTGLELHTRSESPVGAGIGGSSALTIAVCGALAAWTDRVLYDEQLLQIALYGGVSAVELRVDGVRRVALPVDAAELGRRLVLAYTGASRNSGINNWDATKRHIEGDREVYQSFARIRDIACTMRDALERSDWTEVGRQLANEWESRKRLAPGVTTPAIDSMLQAAATAGALGGKVCGAGGGGCLFCIGPPERVPAIATALASAGARVLEFRIETEGLKIDTRVAA